MKKNNKLVKENASDQMKWRRVVKTMTTQYPANSIDREKTD